MINRLARRFLVIILGSIYDFKLYLSYLRYRFKSLTRGALHTSMSGECDIGKKLCIFSLYQPHGVPETVYYQLLKIYEYGYSIYIVSNTKINHQDKERLKRIVWRIDERPNIGRDFGGYKHGVLQVTSYLSDIERLMLANDSVFGPLFDLPESTREIDAQDNDFWGINENLEFGNHIASYFLVFKPRAFKHKAFMNYWHSYQEKSSRKHSIKKGEIGLNKALRKVALKPGVLCSSQRMFEVLSAKPNSLSILELLSTTPVSEEAWSIVSSVWSGNNGAAIGERFDPAIQRRLIKLAVQTFERTSAPHTFALIMNRELKCPFLKRDIVRRNVLDLGILISSIMVNTDYPAENIEFEYRIKGSITDLSPFHRVLDAGGYI